MNTQLNIRPAKRIVYPILLMAMTTFFSCSKNDSANNENAITEEEAAEVVSQSVEPEGDGMVVHIEDAASVSNTIAYLGLCGVAKDSTVAAASLPGATVSWSYSHHWHWMLSCNDGHPSKFDLTFDGSSNFDGPRLSATHSSNASLAITGLEIAATQYTVNETMVRTGTYTSKIHRQITFTSEATFKAIDVKVNKITKKIVSGTAEVTIKGTTSTGRSFSYSGILTFNGNGRGEFRLRNGHIFMFQW